MRRQHVAAGSMSRASGATSGPGADGDRAQAAAEARRKAEQPGQIRCACGEAGIGRETLPTQEERGGHAKGPDTKLGQLGERDAGDVREPVRVDRREWPEARQAGEVGGAVERVVAKGGAAEHT